jgi:hypothetical protein
VLDVAVITALQTGLTNDIMRASNMDAPSGESLEGALKGQTLDPNAMAGISNSLTEAAASLNLSQDTISSLTGLLKPMSKSALGM